jgi:aarF domain-containing kinase
MTVLGIAEYEAVLAQSSEGDKGSRARDSTHGLYVQLTEEFRRDWHAVWEGLLAGEWSVVDGVTRKWSVAMPDLFFHVVLMWPVKLGRGRPQQRDPEEHGKPIEEMTNYERSAMKAKLKGFLTDTDRMPKALIFLLRNMWYAPRPFFISLLLIFSVSLQDGPRQQQNPRLTCEPHKNHWLRRLLRPHAAHRVHQSPHAPSRVLSLLFFHPVMFSIDLSFWVAQTWQWVWHMLGLRRDGMAFEDKIERSVHGIAKSSFGIDVGADVFDR